MRRTRASGLNVRDFSVAPVDMKDERFSFLTTSLHAEEDQSIL